MKKFLLGTVGLVALGMAAPAIAADLAARPYTKAPPVYVDPMYNWSGFYIGMNGGWGSSRNRYEWTGPLECSHSGMGLMQPAAPLAGRSAIIGRLVPGCSVSKLKATGPI